MSGSRQQTALSGSSKPVYLPAKIVLLIGHNLFKHFYTLARFLQVCRQFVDALFSD